MDPHDADGMLTGDERAIVTKVWACWGIVAGSRSLLGADVRTVRRALAGLARPSTVRRLRDFLHHEATEWAIRRWPERARRR